MRCTKRSMTEAEARYAVTQLQQRNKKNRRNRRRTSDMNLNGKMHAYRCPECDAWHVGHWRPREAKGGTSLPPQSTEPQMSLFEFIANFGNGDRYKPTLTLMASKRVGNDIRVPGWKHLNNRNLLVVLISTYGSERDFMVHFNETKVKS